MKKDGKARYLVLPILCLALSIQVFGQFPAKGRLSLPDTWRGLTPLESTQTDAERILGRPNSMKYSTGVFDSSTERVDVLYSVGRCSPGEDAWKLPAGTVITVTIYPKKVFVLRNVVFDRSRFVRQKWSHPADWVTYRDEKRGITIDTVDLGKKIEIVRMITYGPKAEQAHLRCPR